jgi:hypothetical protein
MLEALAARLKDMTDAQLAGYYLCATYDMLQAGEPLRYDPDQNPANIDYWEQGDEDPSTNELVALRIMDMCQSEIELRRATSSPSS